jgi:hypothetical protein
MALNMTKKKLKGFGLIELFFVISIIFTFLLMVNEKRKDIGLKEDVRLIATAIKDQSTDENLQNISVEASRLSVESIYTLERTVKGYYTLSNTGGGELCFRLRVYQRFDVDGYRLENGKLDIDRIYNQCNKDTEIRLIPEKFVKNTE